MTNTLREGRAALGRVPIVFAPAPPVLICLAAPCRCTTPKPSLNQAGLPEPNPALPDQFTVFRLIGDTADTRTGAAGEVTAAPAAPAPNAVTLTAAAMAPSPAAARRTGREARNLIR